MCAKVQKKVWLNNHTFKTDTKNRRLQSGYVLHNNKNHRNKVTV